MTTLADSMDALHAWVVDAVQGHGLYPFDASRVRWGEQDYPRAETPLVTIDVIAHSKVSGPAESTRRQDDEGTWLTYTRITYEMTARIECWTRYDRVQPDQSQRADVLLDRISQFGSERVGLDILDAGGLGLLRFGDILASTEADGASTLRVASREVVLSRVSVSTFADDYIEAVEITANVDPMDPITFTVEP